MKSVHMKEMLKTLGYREELFSEDYSVQIDGTSAVCFDYVAFGDKDLKDISTSCIAMKELADAAEEIRYVDGAKYLAAPVVLISLHSRVHIWGVEPQKPTLLCDDDNNLIYLYFEKNRFEFMPDSLVKAKMGYRQLDIFEAMGLIDFSREATCKILSEEFEKGFTAAQNYLENENYLGEEKHLGGQELNHITSITMHVISALIINSKMNYMETVPENVFMLIEKLEEEYKDYFNGKEMLKFGKGLLNAIYENLNRSINYRSIDHELLGYFYESTLLQSSESRAKSIRKDFGIYYTPKVLSQEIARSIPFETIPLEERHVLDGTCGSGSLLLSACRRLEDLVCYEKSGVDRHNYLTEMIAGYDKDQFASEVARLSLLLYSLPYGNRWDIRAGDLLCINESQIKIPYVILGNPPYGEVRGEQKRIQKAMAFLDKYLDILHEEGYIGIVLPESFLQNDSCIFQRKRLLEEFDIIELWVLPGHIFKNNCATAVIIAQKKKADENAVTKVKILPNNEKAIRGFLKQGTWDFSFFSNQDKWKRGSQYKICISPMESILEKIVKGKRVIRDISKSITGIMIQKSALFSERKQESDVSYIVNAKQFRNYIISPKMQKNVKFLEYHMSDEKERELTRDYPGLRLRKEFEPIYSATDKVMVKMSSTPGKIECIQAFVDEEGYYPSHSIMAIVPNDSYISSNVICTLINSKLINAFVRMECVKRTITADVIRSIPVPDFTDFQIQEIEVNFKKIKSAYKSGNKAGIKAIQERMNDIIFEAFRLTPAERKEVRRVFQIYDGKLDKTTSAEPKNDHYTNVSGQVDEIIGNEGGEIYCSVYLAEFGRQEILVEDTMPGWFLRKGMEFSARYHNGRLSEIKPLVYSYLKDEELVALLDSKFSKG